MHRAELTGINNHLYRLEKELNRLEPLIGKGCTVDYSLSDIYAGLKSVGESLKIFRSEERSGTIELDEQIEKHKVLLIRFNSITNKIEQQENGMVFVSKKAIPDFFYKLTRKHHGFWHLFENVATLSGVGLIFFTLFIITFYSYSGYFPLIHHYTAESPSLKVSGFIIGLVMGLFTHEFAHGIVLANNGIKIKQAGLMAGAMIGGFIEADETTFFQADHKVHLRFNASSIGTNALIAVFIGITALVFSSGFLIFIALGNLFFGIINSFPVRPLDGGWTYEDLIDIYLENRIIKKLFFYARFAFAIVWLILFTYSVLKYSV